MLRCQDQSRQMTGWQLPKEACIGGKTYTLHTDFREILEIFGWLQDETKPEFFRWYVALALFFEEEIPDGDFYEAAEYFRWFVCRGQPETDPATPALLHWQQDAQDIAADVNKVAGREIREMPYLHWWTFLGWFHGIGEGNLSMLVSVRDKLRRGKKLEPHEREFYRRNRGRVQLRPEYTPEELAQQARLQALLDPPCGEREDEYGE